MIREKTESDIKGSPPSWCSTGLSFDDLLLTVMIWPEPDELIASESLKLMAVDGRKVLSSKNNNVYFQNNAR